jgi:hypothetical protein
MEFKEELPVSDLIEPRALTEQGWATRFVIPASETIFVRGDRIDGLYEVTWSGDYRHAKARRIP